MTQDQSDDVQKTPWHLWLVGILGFLWSSMGAMDYVMTQLKHEEYMQAFTPEQLSFFYAIPTWAIATWAIAVWGGVLGCLLLLLKKTAAVWVLLASLVAMFLTSIQNYVLSNGFEVIGDAFSLIFTGVIFLASIGLYLYAKAQQRN